MRTWCSGNRYFPNPHGVALTEEISAFHAFSLGDNCCFPNPLGIVPCQKPLPCISRIPGYPFDTP